MTEHRADLAGEPNLVNILAWVEGLESEEFQQDIGAIRIFAHDGSGTKRYCCLGVATELAARAGVIPNDCKWNTDPENKDCSIHFGASKNECDLWCRADHDGDELSPEVQEWLGIDESSPELPGRDGFSTSAIILNDIHNNSFMQIAKRIRRRWLPDTLEGNDA